MSKQYTIAGIGTDVGKTVVSAILAEALAATYLKPIQAGDLSNSDSVKVRSWCSEAVTVLPELCCLEHPMSPHAAAEREGVTLDLDALSLSIPDGNFILEGAGGVLVPINYKGETVLDIYKKVNLPVIVVSRHYLGSINHTLLTINEIKRTGLTIKGIVFVGPENKATEDVIKTYTGVTILGRIPIVEEVNVAFIHQQAELLKPVL